MENKSPTAPLPNGDMPRQAAEPSIYLTPSKRKLDSTSGQPNPGELSENRTRSTSETAENSLGSLLKDVLEVVSKHDTELNLLHHPLPSKTNWEPHNKRAKLSEPESKTSIESKINEEKYNSIQDFTEDVETVVSLILNNSQASGRPQHLRSFTADELSIRVNSFKKHLNLLLSRSRHFQSSFIKTEAAQDQDDSSPVSPAPLPVPPSEDRAILTVTLGNPPRTYFSSFQQPLVINASPQGIDMITKPITFSLDESSLPEEVRVSKVVPFDAVSFEKERGKPRTFGEVFQPPPHLPFSKRPQQNKKTSSDNVVRWLKPVDVLAASSTTLTGKKLYNNERLTPGDWLHYGYCLPQATHITGLADHDDEIEDSPKENETLFRSVYSSFAPGYDSGGAVVQNNTQNMAYWDTRGKHRFGHLFPDWDFDDTEPIRQLFEHTTLEPQSLDETELQLAIENFVPDSNIEDLEKNEDDRTEPPKDPDVSQVLQDISDLLQMLHSYRQLRNLCPPPGKLADATPDTFSQLSDQPSEEETITYEALKTSLSSMIALLPPFAVAKLDGDQLADLNINTTMTQDSIDYIGTMEEDEWTMRQKQVPRMTQSMSRSPAPSVHAQRAPVYQTPPHPNLTPHQRYQPVPRVRNPQTSYQSPQVYNTRQQQQPIQYPTTLPPSAPSFVTTPQPSQRFVQPPYQQQSTPAHQYTRAGMLQQFQRSTQNTPTAPGNQPGPSPSQTPQSLQQQQQFARSVPLTNFTPRQNAVSPHRPANYAQTPPRPPYLNQSPVATQPRYFQSQGQPSPQYANFPPNQPNPLSYPSNPAAMPHLRGTAEHAALLERNRAPLLEAQRRAAALNSPSQAAAHQTPLNGHGNTPRAPQAQVTPKP